MRIVIESKKVLVVESSGRQVLCFFLVFVLLHVCYLLQGPARDLTSTNVTIIGVSAICYVIFGILALGPLADKITVTFHGAKHLVRVERKLPFDKAKVEEYSFDDFTHYELSEPFDRGFCRLRLKDGKIVKLFKIKKNDEYASLKHLDSITRKKVEMVK